MLMLPNFILDKHRWKMPPEVFCGGEIKLLYRCGFSAFYIIHTFCLVQLSGSHIIIALNRLST